MDPAQTDQNLLFAVLALQLDLIDERQFAAACASWAARKESSLAEMLRELGWITPECMAEVERILGRKLRKMGGDARASLAAAADQRVRRSLAGCGDPGIERWLADLPRSGDLTTVDHVAGQRQRYTLSHLHAAGGIGRVWLARDGDLGRDIALKELRPEQALESGAVSRFLREARVTGQLEHPGIIPVYELARRDGDQQPFYTMRFVKGRTLSEAVRAYHGRRVAGEAGPLELTTLLAAFVTICNTVAYAHSRGVIHRDLKGQNVVLGDFGEVIVLDWGLAKVKVPLEADALPVCPAPEGEVDPALTQAGQALGTPAYMAPEQAAGRVDLIDERTDVYGLGAILYEILTGRPPFTGTEVDAVLRDVREREPEPPRRLHPELPSALEAICLRALAKGPTDRYGSAAELAQAVQGWQEAQRQEAEAAVRERLIQEQRLASIGHLVAGVAHEINNPLAFIHNNLAILQRDLAGGMDVLTLYQGAHQQLAKVAPEVSGLIEERGAEIDLPYIQGSIDQLISRSQQGAARVVEIRAVLERPGPRRRTAAANRGGKPLPCRTWWKSAWRSCVRGSRSTGRNWRPIRTYAPGAVREPPDQSGDRDPSGNAQHAIELEHGYGGRIEVTTRQLGADVLIEVAHNGRGIAAEDLHRIFDPFFSPRDAKSSTGLGLSLSKKVIESHGGRIEVESQPGRTRYRVFLPLKDET